MEDGEGELVDDVCALIISRGLQLALCVEREKGMSKH